MKDERTDRGAAGPARVQATETSRDELLAEISRLRRTNEQLSASNARLCQVVDNASAMIGAKDLEGRHLFVNRHFTRVTGLAPAEVVGQTDADLFPPEVAEALRQGDRSVIESGEARTFEQELRLPSGRRSFVVVKFPLRDSAGRMYAVCSFASEITEREGLEQENAQRSAELEALLANAPVGFAFFDKGLRYARVNDVLARIDGVPPEEHVGKTLAEVLGDGAGPIETALRQVALTGRGVPQFEVTPGVRAGVRRKATWLYEFFPVFDEDRDLIFIGAVVSDVTELKQTERALKRAHARADAASRAKSEFLANMSHEIRTPMSAILGYAQLLESHLGDPDDLTCVDTIRRNGEHLLELINDVLDLSKVEAGRMEFTPQAVAPDRLAAEVCSLMMLRASDKGLTLDVEFRGRLPAVIRTDPRRLRQILINLLGNAIKFTDQGGVRLVVGMRPDEARLEFSVVDTGIGMTVAQQRALFRPFSQADTSDAREFEGTGLGLAISQRLAEFLGGTITFESRRRRGSTFRLSIDVGSLEDVEWIEPRRAVPGPEDPPPEPLPRLECRVLVVDDRGDIRYLVEHVLEIAGARVSTADDGASAIAAILEARDDPFHVVVMDMQMPVLDGYAATRRLRVQGQRLPILALTAGAMKGEREKCLAAGCTDYLTKPIDTRQLVRMVARYAHGVPGGEWPLHVLLVDDSRDSCHALAAILRLQGFEVKAVYDGESALVAARAEPFDAIVSDLTLPGIDGGRLARELRSDPGGADRLLIAVSGHADLEQRATDSGFDASFLKPVDLDLLLHALEGARSRHPARPTDTPVNPA